MNIVKFLLMMVIGTEIIMMVGHMISCSKFFRRDKGVDGNVIFEFYAITLISAIIMALQLIMVRQNRIELMSFIMMIIYTSLILGYQFKINDISRRQEIK